jgi:ABC-type multidrug transport system fused ATPase/permease subunit
MAATDLSRQKADDARTSPAPETSGPPPEEIPGATSVREIAAGFWSISRPKRGLAVASVVFATIAGIFDGTALLLLVPLLQGTDSHGKEPGPASPALEALGFHGRAFIWACVVGFGLMVLTAAVGRFASAAALATARSRTEAVIRKDLTKRLLGMEWSAFLMTRLGDISSSLLMESSQVGAGIQMFFTSLAAILVASFYIALALFVSARLSAVIAGLALVTLFVLRPISRRAESYTRSLGETTQEIARRVADVLGNLKFFRSTGTRTRAEALFAASYDEYATQFRQTLVAPFAVHLGYELTALVFIVTMIAVAISGASKLTGATLILLAVFWRLSPQLRLLQGGMVQVRVQYPWLVKWQERVATAGAHRDRPSGTGTPTFAERLTVDHVSFSFPGVPACVLDDVSWELQRGGVVALVGESGAGKTTTLDLVSGLLVPTEGSVLLDGLPLTMLDVDQWQSHIGLVLDQSPLFHATVRENIVGDGEPDDARVWQALVSANAATFVRELPVELDTVIGERGGRLSGGQRQRIGLARALYRQPWLLILDEATSALDSVSEGVVLEALESLRGDVSMLIVAHRLTTVRMADRIYVLENGRTVQAGTWDELLAEREGTFARMAAKQGIFGGPASVASH